MRKGIYVLFFWFISCPFIYSLEPGSFHADGKPGKKAIALTFDDGPGPFSTQVLDLLDKQGVQATFFMNGDQVQIRPEIAKEVQKRGHEVGEHTWSHINFYAYEKAHGREATQAKIREEMKKSKEILQKTLGLSPKICRMPHGYHRSWLKEIAKEFGYALVNWTFGEDWTAIPEDMMAKDYVAHVRSGSILLFHDGGKNRTKTLHILPQVIQEAKSRGLAFLTVSQILE